MGAATWAATWARLRGFGYETAGYETALGSRAQ
jgi:hypothetical protein